MDDRAEPETRRTILRAANEVVRSTGVGGLTLEAVARAAGVSKGGLLYHFPAKTALIEGMIGDLLDRCELAVARELENDPTPDAPGRRLRAYVLATATDEERREATTALLAAVGSDPSLLRPVRERFADWQRRFEADGLDPALATTIRFAADGLWLADLFGLAPPGPELRRRVVDALVALTFEGMP